MAEPIEFHEQDDVATSFSHKQNVGPLPVKNHERSSTSCWRLSPEEIKHVQETGVIWVVTSTFDQKPEGFPVGERLQPTIRVTVRKSEGLQPID